MDHAIEFVSRNLDTHSNFEIVGIACISRQNGPITRRHMARECMPRGTGLGEHLAPKWPSVILLECM